MHNITITGLLAALLSGCGALPNVAPGAAVAPWEKGMLAQPNMRFDGNRGEARYTAHIYDSREAASGAGSVGGGGCGCN